MKILSVVLCLLLISGCTRKSHNADGTTTTTTTTTIAAIGDLVAQIPDSAIETGCTYAGNAAGQEALKLAEAKDPALTKVVAQQLSLNINTVILPYLDGNPPSVSTIVMNEFNSKLLKGLPDFVIEGIGIGSIPLNQYIKIPTETRILTSQEILALRSFALGVTFACDDFLGNKAIRHKPLIHRSVFNYQRCNPLIVKPIVIKES